MVVNSFAFFFFFVVVISIYYLPITRKNRYFQNLWLLLSSYFFYGYADITMIPLLFGSSLIFYILGKYLKQTMEKDNWTLASHLTTLGVVLGVCILLYFKYLNFFADSIADLLNLIGLKVTWTTLNIILPIGVSFFTFKLISYIIEIHRERIEPADNFIDFALYISFFPTILSGPIDRPNKFLPQLSCFRRLLYENISSGFKLVIWGWFMKSCIADRLTIYIDAVFNNYSAHSIYTISFATLLYPLQMYSDFAGYSFMAIGVGLMLGLKVTENFRRPFFAQNVSDYWTRWHMSLTSWITDYIFMPLNIAFRSIGKTGIILAVIINLIVIGLWHGANWTFGLFGLYHGLLFIPLILSGGFGKKNKIKPSIKWLLPFNAFYRMLVTYLLVAFGLLIFRSANINEFFSILSSLNDNSEGLFIDGTVLLLSLMSYFILFIKDYKDELKLDIHFIHSKKHYVSMLSTIFLIAYILIFGVLDGGQFIYFQF